MIQQPLDTLMTQLGLTNAALVKASTEQLTFKMVHKGRTGRRLTPNAQEKILNALLAAKPGLQVRRKDLFHYEPSGAFLEGIARAMALVRSRKIKYPQYVDLLVEAGVTGYTAEVAPNRVTFFGMGGTAHTEQGPAISSAAPGYFNDQAIRSAIADAQKEVIDHPTFLKRIYEAGVVVYDVNTRSRKIVYKGTDQAYRESIAPSGVAAEPVLQPTPVVKKAAKAPSKKKAKPNKKKSMTRKARISFSKRQHKRRK